MEYTNLSNIKVKKGLLINSIYLIDILKKILSFEFDEKNSFKSEFLKIHSDLFIKIKNDKIIFNHKKIIKNAINMDNKITFTKDQQNAIKCIINFLYNEKIKTYGLYGYAGTGKTTLIVTIVKYLLEKNYVKSIVLTAPTNKAVNIMKSKFRNEINSLLKGLTDNNLIDELNFDAQIRLLEKNGIIIHFMTIHKLLNYKNEFDINGDRVFTKGENDKLDGYELAIIDECSMISIQIMTNLFELLKKKKIKYYLLEIQHNYLL